MRLIVTKHAVQRMHERAISSSELVESIAINAFKDVENGKYVLKRKIGRGVVEVVLERTDKDLIVITAYWV